MNWEVIQGDCLEVMKSIPDGSIDACITDPPYGVGLKYEAHDDSPELYFPMMRSFIAEARRVVKNDGFIALTCGMKHLTWWYQEFSPRWTIAWLKPNQCSPNPLGGFSVWEPVLVWSSSSHIRLRQDAFTQSIGAQPDVSGHPCPKSLDAWRQLLCLWKWPVNATVLDAFCGSGTTGVVCAEMGLDYIGIEKNSHDCEVGRARIQRTQGIAVDIPKPVRGYAPTPLFEAVA